MLTCMTIKRINSEDAYFGSLVESVQNAPDRSGRSGSDSQWRLFKAIQTLFKHWNRYVVEFKLICKNYRRNIVKL